MASCSICLEAITADQQKRYMTGLEPDTKLWISDVVCEGCIREFVIPLFHQAVEKEAQFPVRWGKLVLEPSQFVDLLGQDFIDRFVRKGEEYACTKDRLYCPHRIEASRAPLPGGVAMTQLALDELEIADFASRGLEVESCGGFISQRQSAPGSVTCHRCLGTLCQSCGHATDTTIHTCPPTQPSTNPLQFLTRGLDYQVCPTCSLPSQLGSGCNHITCPCRASFCFICGQPAGAGPTSRHGTEGSTCPLYNQPGATNAVFAEAGRVVEGIELEEVLPRNVFAGRLVVEDEFEQRFSVELRELRNAVREHVEDDVRVPQWVEDPSLVDIEAVFELSLLRKARFSGLKPTSARAAKQNDLLGRVQSRISRFFATRNDLLRIVLQNLLPEGFYRLPRADEAILQHELDGPQDGEGEGELEEEQDEEDGEEEDLVPLTFPPIFISAATPTMLYDYTITVPLTQLIQTYKSHSNKSPGQELSLPGRGIDGSVKISFSGDVDEPWIEWACIEEMEVETDDGGNRTSEFWKGLNEQTGLLAELVQILIS